MPGLVLFNRRWGIGSDDLVFPELGEIGLRLLWLMAIAIVYMVHKNAFDCDGGVFLEVYYIGLLVNLIIHILLCTAIMLTSMRGSILNVQPRKMMPQLLYCKLGFTVPEIVWQIVGSYSAFGASVSCEWHVIWTIRGAVLCGWAAGIGVIIGLLIMFDPLGGRTSSVRDDSFEGNVVLHDRAGDAIKVWIKRVRFLFCCMGRDEHSGNAFSEIGKLLTNFFTGVDLVPTDLAAGLLLIQREHRLRLSSIITVTSSSNGDLSHTPWEEGGPHPESAASSVNNVIDSENSVPKSNHQIVMSTMPVKRRLPPKSWMTIPMMNHYMKYAMASYGWPIYMFTHIIMGACNLWPNCRCCSCVPTARYVEEDNCCQCHFSAIQSFTNIPEEDFIYATFHNKIFEIPFLVAVDRKHNAVVIAIRGTMSFKDVITDMTAEHESYSENGDSECYAHKGITQAAKFILAKIENLDLINKGLQKVPEGSLVIVGHSLGGGAATMLSILLKPKYPDLRCFAYSPPGALLSLSASYSTQDYICSVILGQDLISRLSIVTLDDLKHKLLKAIQKCNQPKYRILTGGCIRVMLDFLRITKEQKHSQQEPLLRGSFSGPSYATNADRFEESVDELLSQSCRSITSCPPLYLPGQILHILEAESTSCLGIPTYHAIWSRPEEFQKIIVSHQMLSDHLPDFVMRSVQQLYDRNFVPVTMVNSEGTFCQI